MAATAAVVGTVLAAIDVIGWTLPVVAVIVALICMFLFRRTVGSR